MISKFLQRTNKLVVPLLGARVLGNLQTNSGRVFANLIPPSQYDMPRPNRLKIGYVLINYWETIPLFLTTAAALAIVFSAIVWACKNKVDIVFTPYSRENISRTMDLRHPTVHKLLIINQRYPPWPEMQDVLDKMKQAEKKLMLRTQTCSFAP